METDRDALIDFFSIPAPRATRRERSANRRTTRFDRLYEEAKKLGSYLERETGPGFRYTVDLTHVDQGVACCATLDDVEDELRALRRAR